MIEKLPARESPEDRFQKLRIQAEREITAEILRRKQEPNELEAQMTAQQMFDDRTNYAANLYEAAMDTFIPPQSASSTFRSRQFAEALVAQIAQKFSEGGYMRQVIALRLSAALVEQLKDEDEEDEDGGPADDAGFLEGEGSH